MHLDFPSGLISGNFDSNMNLKSYVSFFYSFSPITATINLARSVLDAIITYDS